MRSSHRSRRSRCWSRRWSPRWLLHPRCPSRIGRFAPSRAFNPRQTVQFPPRHLQDTSVSIASARPSPHRCRRWSASSQLPTWSPGRSLPKPLAASDHMSARRPVRPGKVHLAPTSELRHRRTSVRRFVRVRANVARRFPPAPRDSSPEARSPGFLEPPRCPSTVEP